MKYRHRIIACDYVMFRCQTRMIIQVKKWYGWVTIYSIEDEYNEALKKVNFILKELRNE